MRALGIRTAPRELTFAVYDSEASAVINVEGIRLPAALSVPENLKYIRSNLLDVLREYQIEKAGIRTTEPNSQQLSIERIQIEGVVQEAFASSMLQGYYAGPIATIAAKLGMKRAVFKELVNGDQESDIENWGKMKPNQREAILTAMGAVNV